MSDPLAERVTPHEPWTAEYYEGTSCIEIQDAEGRVLAALPVVKTVFPGEVVKATALLMAAAPDLLAASQLAGEWLAALAIMESPNGLRRVLEALQTAIQKAAGAPALQGTEQ